MKETKAALLNHPLLTINEVAKLLGVTTQRIRYEVFQKRIPYIKLGASLRFSRTEIENWIEELSVKKSSCE